MQLVGEWLLARRGLRWKGRGGEEGKGGRKILQGPIVVPCQPSVDFDARLTFPSRQDLEKQWSFNAAPWQMEKEKGGRERCIRFLRWTNGSPHPFHFKGFFSTISGFLALCKGGEKKGKKEKEKRE